MSKGVGVYPSEWRMSKGVFLWDYLIAGRGITASVFLTEALGRFEVCYKWSKSKEFRFHALIRVRKFHGNWVRGVVLLSSSNKFLRDAIEL